MCVQWRLGWTKADIEAAVRAVQMNLHLSLGSITVSLKQPVTHAHPPLHHTPTTTEPLVVCRLHGMRLQLLKRAFDWSMQLRLRRFSVRDHLHRRLKGLAIAPLMVFTGVAEDHESDFDLDGNTPRGEGVCVCVGVVVVCCCCLCE